MGGGGWPRPEKAHPVSPGLTGGRGSGPRPVVSDGASPPQAAAPEPADPHQRGGDQLHGRPASAQHGQVQLQQVWLRAGAFLPVPEPGGEAGLVPRVPVSRPLRGQHGGGEREAGTVAAGGKMQVRVGPALGQAGPCGQPTWCSQEFKPVCTNQTFKASTFMAFFPRAGRSGETGPTSPLAAPQQGTCFPVQTPWYLPLWPCAGDPGFVTVCDTAVPSSGGPAGRLWALRPRARNTRL